MKLMSTFIILMSIFYKNYCGKMACNARLIHIGEFKIKEQMERTKKGRAISDPALKPNS